MKRFLIAANLFLLSTGVFAAGIGNMGKFTDLVKVTCTWLQGIGLAVAMGGFVLAGMRFISGEHDAKDKVKSALIGSAIIAGASVIVSFIGDSFGVSAR